MGEHLGYGEASLGMFLFFKRRIRLKIPQIKNEFVLNSHIECNVNWLLV